MFFNDEVKYEIRGKWKMKKTPLIITVLMAFSLVSGMLAAQSGRSLDAFVGQLNEAVPDGFILDDSGMDGEDIYAVYKRNTQEIITANLQEKNDVEFSDVEELMIQGRRAVFYHLGYEKNGGMAVFLSEGSGYLVVGYNKPYMGDEIVECRELEDIVGKIDLKSLEN